MIAPDLTRLSPNVNHAPVVGRTVIIHATRSGVSMNPTEFDGTLNYMAMPGTTSSQWVISRTGLKARVVPDNLQAWHAQEDNVRTWGIELEQGVENDGFTPEQLYALQDVCRGYVQDFHVPAIHVGSSTEPGFVGHQETIQGRRNGKSDPGHLFPWLSFIAALEGDPDLSEQERQELDERRAGAILQTNLLQHYRTAFAGPAEAPWEAVRLLQNDGSETGIVIPTPIQPVAQ